MVRQGEKIAVCDSCDNLDRSGRSAGDTCPECLGDMIGYVREGAI